MSLLALLTPLVVLAAVLALQRLEGWMERPPSPRSGARRG